MTTRVRALFIVLLALYSSGCSALSYDDQPILGVMAPLPDELVCRVAVLPFINDSKYPQGDIIATKIFSAQFQNVEGSLEIQEGDILKVYRQLHIFPGVAPNLDQLQIIADRVNAQLLITGIVIEMREDRGLDGTVGPLVILEVQIHDGRTGEPLSKTYHRRRGSDYTKVMHFGTIHSVSGLTRQIALEIINLWFKKGLMQCNNDSPRS